MAMALKASERFTIADRLLTMTDGHLDAAADPRVHADAPRQEPS